MFRLTDRRGADMLLAPTHEELFALLAKAELLSYRNLPLLAYQVRYIPTQRPGRRPGEDQVDDVALRRPRALVPRPR